MSSHHEHVIFLLQKKIIKNNWIRSVFVCTCTNFKKRQILSRCKLHRQMQSSCADLTPISMHVRHWFCLKHPKTERPRVSFSVSTSQKMLKASAHGNHLLQVATLKARSHQCNTCRNVSSDVWQATTHSLTSQYGIIETERRRNSELWKDYHGHVCEDYKKTATGLCRSHSSGAVWESRWPSWAVRPDEPSGFRGRKAILNHASGLVSACP